MNERKGEVFSIASENAPVDGCTVSKAVAEVAGRRISHFALSAGTDISPETYDYHKLWVVIDGEGEVLAAKNAKIAKELGLRPVRLHALHAFRARQNFR